MTDWDGSELYTDVVMELLSAYILTDPESNDDLIELAMNAVQANKSFPADGLMEGLTFASIIHLSIMLTYVAKTLGIDRQDILAHYAIVYQNIRETIQLLPGVHPDFVSELAIRLREMKDA